MVGLLATLAIGPWLQSIGARALVYTLAIAALASAVHAVGGGRRYAVAVILLGSLGVAVLVIAPVASSPGWAEVALGLFMAFGAFTLIRLLGYVVRPGPITVDNIYAGRSVCLLAGLTSPGLYALAEVLHPGSFHWTHVTGHERDMLRGFVYVSFVTLASLGYGDVTPISPVARSLAILEAIFGIFYVVVIIARLVAGYEARTRGG